MFSIPLLGVLAWTRKNKVYLLLFAAYFAQWLPWIGLIGRKGLLCFIAGAVISLVVDSILYAATDGYLDYPLGLLADAIAVGALLVVAVAAQPLTRLAGRIVGSRLGTSP